MSNAWLTEGSAAASLAWLALTGLVYLVVYLSDRRRTANGWLVLFSLGAALFPLSVLSAPHALFGLSTEVAFSIAAPLTAVASIYFTHARFGLNSPSVLWWFPVGVVWLLVTGVGQGVLPAAVVGSLAVVVVSGCMLYQLATLTRLSRRTPRVMDVRVMLVAWSALSAALFVDLLRILSEVQLTLLGLCAFAFLLTMTQARAYLRTLAQAEDLRGELAARLEVIEANYREIDTLNAELRRQVGLRSRQLAQALAHLAGASEARGALPLGHIIAGRYQVEAQLGSGSMGAVYRIRRLSDMRALALKVLIGSPSRNTIARFAREAEVLASLHHPNLVSIFDVGLADSGRLFFVMELVSGQSLERSRSRSDWWSLSVLSQVSEGLAAVHGRGCIHRDLKPANILIQSDGDGAPQVKIADFGLSRLPRSDAADGPEPSVLCRRSDRLTIPGIVMGTPMYMAPELAEGARAAGLASDIFSFGIIAYELLCGQHPFSVSPFAQRLCGEVPSPNASLDELCPDLDPTLRGLVDACLSVHPADRPTADEVAVALRDALCRASNTEVVAELSCEDESSVHGPTLPMMEALHETLQQTDRAQAPPELLPLAV